MTQDEIIQFAHASSHNHKWYYIIEGTKKASPTEMRFLTRFSKLVAQHERKKFSLVLKQLHDHYSFASKTEFKGNIND